MKITYLLPAIFLLSVVSAHAQERPRYFDNFDTSRGVQTSSLSQPTGNTTRNAAPRNTTNPYAPSPVTRGNISPASLKFVKRTVQVTMTVYDGYAQREAPRAITSPSTIMARGGNMKGFSTGDDLIDSYIVDSSRRYSIDPLLIYAQMSQESSFKPRALSHKGASGLMQLMPATARRLGVTNIYDPKQNIEGGVKYMRLLLDMFSGDVNLALAGYNAGEGAVMKYGRQIPPYNETQDYVRRISSRYKAISGTRPSDQYQAEIASVRLADGGKKLVNR